MFMKGIFMLFLSLSLGYVLCVVAKKQEGVLKSVGYTIGISIMVLSLVYSLILSYMGHPLKHKFCGPMSKMHGMASKMCPMMK